jgi:hypothetical protein
MDDDIEFNFDLPFPLLPGVDLALWLNIIIGVLIVAVIATAIALLV